ncbi:MAG: lysylphosphatidylglycerol synthase transmembrane domain-containing protein [Pseudomonadota bacterium]
MSDATPEQSGSSQATGIAVRSGSSRLTLLKILISVLLLGFLVHKIELAKATEILEAINPWLAGLATLVLFAVPAVSIPRWRAILASLGHALPTTMIARALYIGAFFNQMLPSSIGGDGWRIWFCTRVGVSLGAAANSVLIERLVGLLAVLFCFCLTFPNLLQRVGDHPVRWLLWLMLASCLGAVLGLTFVALAARRLERVRLLRPLASLGLALASVAHSSQVALLLWTGALGQLVAIIAFFLVSQSVGAPLSLIDCAVTLAPGLLVALVPVSLGGWGMREGAFVVLLDFYGVKPEQSLIVSILFGLALLVASLPGLVLWFGPSERGLTGASAMRGR